MVKTQPHIISSVPLELGINTKLTGEFRAVHIGWKVSKATAAVDSKKTLRDAAILRGEDIGIGWSHGSEALRSARR